MRDFDVSFEVELDPNDPALDTVSGGPEESCADVRGGARYTAALSDDWSFTARVGYTIAF